MCEQETWRTLEFKNMVIDIIVNAVSAERRDFAFTANHKYSSVTTATAPLKLLDYFRQY
jgi:hypothetical protein